MAESCTTTALSRDLPISAADATMPSLRRRRAVLLAALIGSSVAVAGCVTQGPAGPTVMALPARGESLTSFQQHDVSCRQYASAQTGAQTPGQAATDSRVAGAVVGTGIGAGVGALIGSATGRAGSGAAIGAGSGLLAGTLTGGIAGRKAAAAKQNSYNIAYTQCMVANGERVAHPVAAPVTYVAPYPGVVYVPAPAAVARPVGF